jgi:hypothetical protein
MNDEKVEFEVKEEVDESAETETKEEENVEEQSQEIDIVDVVKELADRVETLTAQLNDLIGKIESEKEAKKEKLKGFFAPVDKDKEKVVENGPTYDSIFIKG